MVKLWLFCCKNKVFFLSNLNIFAELRHKFAKIQRLLAAFITPVRDFLNMIDSLWRDGSNEVDRTRPAGHKFDACAEEEKRKKKGGRKRTWTYRSRTLPSVWVWWHRWPEVGTQTPGRSNKNLLFFGVKSWSWQLCFRGSRTGSIHHHNENHVSGLLRSRSRQMCLPWFQDHGPQMERLCSRNMSPTPNAWSPGRSQSTWTKEAMRDTFLARMNMSNTSCRPTLEM